MNEIGIIHSPFKEKFSIPRQPGLNTSESIIELLPPYNRHEAITGLEHFSHLWVIFKFHAIAPTENEISLTVRPPRLGGNTKQGVFATRSPFRPNNIGLSVVEIKKIEGTQIIIKGGDFLDKTPIYDLKPYIREIESIPHARSSWTDSITSLPLNTFFECECNDQELKTLIEEVLRLDPRPAFHHDDKKSYAMKLKNVDVHWRVKDNTAIVTSIVTLS